eukprot:997921-Rhodomonas_salina.1
MTAITAEFDVTPLIPTRAEIAQQPLRSVANWPIGSICRERHGSVCVNIAVERPPQVNLIDEFGNLAHAAQGYFACATVTRAASSVSIPLLGETQAPVVQGIARFDNVRLTRAQVPPAPAYTHRDPLLVLTRALSGTPLSLVVCAVCVVCIWCDACHPVCGAPS